MHTTWEAAEVNFPNHLETMPNLDSPSMGFLSTIHMIECVWIFSALCDKSLSKEIREVDEIREE